MSKMDRKAAAYFAKKGMKSLAAHERREAAGKEKDTPAIMRQEMKALKGAPKKLRDYEKKEHKKGYAKGGVVRGGGCAMKGVGRGRMV